MTHKERERIQSITKVIAAGLHAAQLAGLIKFPRQTQAPLTEEEIRGSVEFVLSATLMKAEAEGIGEL